ncbi:MAG: hypothetical protein KZQ86_14635, partial [Candidatus Thiodiazotropha sp. (ex Lucinoma kastoroae)]|nr:hypothetical protein [Candidatus Thiodiazotropha sp. (ex Lucinoma kastoroae)]
MEAIFFLSQMNLFLASRGEPYMTPLLTPLCLLFNIIVSSVALAEDPGFSTDELIESGIDGMFDESCGGYCIVGACAHLNIRISWRGISYYTIISPKIRHAVPDLVVSSYNHIGNEPWVEWRDFVGRVMNNVNTGPVANFLDITDG